MAPMATPNQFQHLETGTIVILLAGLFRGKRVVFLKSLDDGTLVVTGPFSINGVPLRRVHPQYTIVTSTKISDLQIELDKFDSKYFEEKYYNIQNPNEKSETDFFQDDNSLPTHQIDPRRIQDQKDVDMALISQIRKTPLLKEYLKTPFSLKDGDKPHEMIF